GRRYSSIPGRSPAFQAASKRSQRRSTRSSDACGTTPSPGWGKSFMTRLGVVMNRTTGWPDSDQELRSPLPGRNLRAGLTTFSDPFQIEIELIESCAHLSEQGTFLVILRRYYSRLLGDE